MQVTRDDIALAWRTMCGTIGVTIGGCGAVGTARGVGGVDCAIVGPGDIVVGKCDRVGVLAVILHREGCVRGDGDGRDGWW